MRHATITVSVKHSKARMLDHFPSAGPYPNITGMKNLFWGKDAFCIRCGAYVYKVDELTYNSF